MEKGKLNLPLLEENGNKNIRHTASEDIYSPFISPDILVGVRTAVTYLTVCKWRWWSTVAS